MKTVELPPDAPPGAGFLVIEDGDTAVFRGWWSIERANQAASAVLAAQTSWTSDFGGRQFALGRAWYTHLETGRSAEYFANAATGDTQVETVLPGLQASMRDAMSSVVGEPVRQRPRWAGAGVHVFPAGGECAHSGGCVHFDDEGLTPIQKRRCPPALSAVLMLRPALRGGGLKLWDVRFPNAERASGDPLHIVSGPGDLVVFSSYQLHQIQPFTGGPRVSATLHAARTRSDWESWF